MNRRHLFGLSAAMFVPTAFAHHGWSGFDQERPLYLEGQVVKVSWRNPHAELEIELPAKLSLPADLAKRAVPGQSASVDAARILGSAQLPTRPDKRWEVELAPLTRIEAWRVPELKVGDAVAVLGYTGAGEQGDAVLRAEYLFAGGKAYGLRSSPV